LKDDNADKRTDAASLARLLSKTFEPYKKRT